MIASLSSVSVLGAAALTGESTMWETLQFQLVGLVIVLLALGALYLLCAATGALFVRLEARKALGAKTEAAAAPGAPAAASPAPAPSEQPDVPIAVIAAAVAATLGRPYRLVSVSPVREGVAWSIEGRRQIFASHQLHRRR